MALPSLLMFLAQQNSDVPSDPPAAWLAAGAVLVLSLGIGAQMVIWRFGWGGMQGRVYERIRRVAFLGAGVLGAFALVVWLVTAVRD